ncbi:MAG: hypothetical protein EAZ85_07740 [Bacteroidetes bacterium]|nr:MAG: hypothetical protein EAZ85_07740 [Bacteroidota bacterium]TAG90193.1 MAG: hypothetical protein EAZ20_04905 [Bacteroidota bacterium]
MKKIFLILISCYFGQLILTAQTTYDAKNRPTKVEKELESQIQTCLKDNAVLEKDFQFADWTAKLQYYTKKTIQRMSSEYVGNIADEKKKAIELANLANSCEHLKKAKPELDALKKIFETKVKDGSEGADVFADGKGTGKVSMKKEDAEAITKVLDKLRKKMAITQVIIRL